MVKAPAPPRARTRRVPRGPAPGRGNGHRPRPFKVAARGRRPRCYSVSHSYRALSESFSGPPNMHARFSNKLKQALSCLMGGRRALLCCRSEIALPTVPSPTRTRVTVVPPRCAGILACCAESAASFEQAHTYRLPLPLSWLPFHRALQACVTCPSTTHEHLLFDADVGRPVVRRPVDVALVLFCFLLCRSRESCRPSRVYRFLLDLVARAYHLVAVLLQHGGVL